MRSTIGQAPHHSSAQLLLNERNVKLFIDAGGIRCLVDLVTLAHLHVSRATVPLQACPPARNLIHI